MSRKPKREFPSEFSDLIAAFAREHVDYLVVGGYAVAAHGRPRATKDLDLWVAGRENLGRVSRALKRFGAPAGLVDAAARLGDKEVLYFGVAPCRVDILRDISAVDFEVARGRAISSTFGASVDVPVISLADLLVNKRAADRPQDRADVRALERIAARFPKGSRA